jgi:putative transposase
VRSFIDEQRSRFGVEPLCKVLQCAPSAYRRHAARQRDPSLRSERAKRDEQLSERVLNMWRINHSVYGADKVW